VRPAVLGLDELSRAAEARLLEGADRGGVLDVGVADTGGRELIGEDDLAREAA